MATDEEKAITDDIMPDLITYRDEMLIKFVKGIEPLDRFDDFVKTLERLGIEDVLKVEQQKYDRYLAAQN